MPSRRSLLTLAFAGVVAAAAPALAAPADDPKAFLVGLYGRVIAGDGTKGSAFYTTPAAVRPRVFTADLCRLWAEADKGSSPDEVGPIDFDVFTASQDPQVRRVDVVVLQASAEAASARVTLWSAKTAKPGEKPFGVLEFALRREKGAWKIDDISGKADDYAWGLRELLSTKPPG